MVQVRSKAEVPKHSIKSNSWRSPDVTGLCIRGEVGTQFLIPLSSFFTVPETHFPSEDLALCRNTHILNSMTCIAQKLISYMKLFRMYEAL